MVGRDFKKYGGVGWVLFLGIFAGCQSPQPKPPDQPFHLFYQAIDDPEALAFLDAGIEVLRRDYAPFEYPVNQIFLRQSRKNEAGHRLRLAEGFSRTEIVDGPGGVFAIYISVAPGHAEFYPLLAHEIGHLRQPSLVDDWEMEGFCMVFSEKLCQELGRDWKIWRRRFTEDPEDPYARAYRKRLANP